MSEIRQLLVPYLTQRRQVCAKWWPVLTPDFTVSESVRSAGCATSDHHHLKWNKNSPATRRIAYRGSQFKNLRTFILCEITYGLWTWIWNSMFPQKSPFKSANEMSHFPFHGHPCIAKYGNSILRHSSCRRKIGGFHFSPFFVCVDCVVESRCPPFVSCKRLHRQSSSTQCCCTYM